MSDFWVFGYGSLMWRPGFEYDAAVPAQLPGAHRSLCVYSVVHRGSRRRPGLVLGLDVGGHCQGVAFRVPAPLVRRTRAYLRAREQVTRVYREMFRPVRLLEGGRVLEARALCFMVDRFHPQYAGRLPLSAQAHLVRHGRGRAGRNADYLANTIRHLTEMGIDEPELRRLMPLVGLGRAAIESAGHRSRR